MATRKPVQPPESTEGASAKSGLFEALLQALGFLTRWPLPARLNTHQASLAQAPLFYPFVGLLLGMMLSMLAVPLQALQPPLAAALLLLFWVWSTGALHLDGLADCADAWIGGMTGPARTLEILKDPRSGPMAVVVLVLALLIKFAGLLTLFQWLGTEASPNAEAMPVALFWLLVAIPMLARAQILALALSSPYVRRTGLGSVLSRQMPRQAALMILVLVWIVFLTLGLLVGQFLLFLLAAVAAWVCFWLWRRSALMRLKGYTGDVAGALVELTELVLLLTSLILIDLR